LSFFQVEMITATQNEGSIKNFCILQLSRRKLYVYLRTRPFKCTRSYFQSEEDKQLQEELNMLVERLQVSINLSYKGHQQFLQYNKYFNNGTKRRWVKIMFWYRTSEVKSQYNRINSRGQMSIKYPVVKLNEQFLQLKSELRSERKYLRSVFCILY
jgi:hypothetical protein